jgi:hypothetical protein
MNYFKEHLFTLANRADFITLWRVCQGFFQNFIHFFKTRVYRGDAGHDWRKSGGDLPRKA